MLAGDFLLSKEFLSVQFRELYSPFVLSEYGEGAIAVSFKLFSKVVLKRFAQEAVKVQPKKQNKTKQCPPPPHSHCGLWLKKTCRHLQ